jgi:hypothetical protein
MTLCFHPFAALYEGIPRDMALPYWAHWEKWVGKSLTKIHVVHGFIWAFFAPGNYVWPKHGVPGGIAGLGFDFCGSVLLLRLRFAMPVAWRMHILIHFCLCNICDYCVIPCQLSEE